MLRFVALVTRVVDTRFGAIRSGATFVDANGIPSWVELGALAVQSAGASAVKAGGHDTIAIEICRAIIGLDIYVTFKRAALAELAITGAIARIKAVVAAVKIQAATSWSAR